MRPVKTVQTGHPPSLNSLRFPHEEVLGSQLLIKSTAKTSQTGPRLKGAGEQQNLQNDFYAQTGHFDQASHPIRQWGLQS